MEAAVVMAPRYADGTLRRAPQPRKSAAENPHAWGDGRVPAAQPASSRATRSGPSRASRERGTTRSKPAASARSRRRGARGSRRPESGALELAAGAQALEQRDPVEALAGEVHDHDGRAAGRPLRPRRARASWPAARSMPSTLEPSSRSSKTATTRAIYCAAGGELLAHRLRAAPHLDGLDAAAAQLAQRQLAGDTRPRRAAAACRAPPAPRRRGRTGGRRGCASASRGASTAGR